MHNYKLYNLHHSTKNRDRYLNFKEFTKEVPSLFLIYTVLQLNVILTKPIFDYLRAWHFWKLLITHQQPSYRFYTILH